MVLVAACSQPAGSGAYSGTIEFPDVAVGSRVGGRVVSVSKREGEPAAAGEVLVTLDPAEWQTAIDEATALADATAREVELLVAGPRQEDIDRAKAEARRLELLWSIVKQGARPEEVAGAREDVAAAEALLAEADAALERERTLVRQGSSTSEALEKVVAAREAARARTAAAGQRLRLLERGARPEEIEAARQTWIAQLETVKALEAGARPEEIAAKRAILAAARARIGSARVRLDEMTIRAPADCFVQTLDLRPGDLLRAGDPVAVLLLSEDPWVTIYVPEADVGRVSLNQKARIDADGHASMSGRVTWISRQAEYTPRNVQTADERTTQVFAVKVVVEGDASGLKDGMWADVRLR